MNIVKIQGGLGNQLFQYAYGLYLEKKLGSSVKYDLGLTLRDKSFTNRDLDIEKIGIKLPLASKNEAMAYKKLPMELWRIERKLTHLFPWINRSYIVRNNPHTPFPIKNDTYYDGYFQRWEYVREILEILRGNITFPQEIYHKYHQQLTDIEDQNATAIHIRRSDYIHIPKNAKTFEICDMSYYNEAIRIIREKTGSKKFFIFTQDKDWARENFNNPEFTIFEGESAIEDFVMMMRCKNQIIANSTFSWWAAVLNPNPSKIVFSPRKWYKDGKYRLEDFIPEAWYQV